MKYLEKSFSHGYADSPDYAKNFDAAFRRKPEESPRKRSLEAGFGYNCAGKGAWKHDMTVDHFKDCCPCSKCKRDNKCSGVVAGMTARHCPWFTPREESR